MKAVLQKNSWLPALLIAGVAVANALAYAEFAAGRASATAAAKNLADCQRLADEIADLQIQPSKVTMQARSAGELSGQMEGAMRTAEVPVQCLVRIDPQPARRIGTSAFKEQPTSLDLRGVTLKQLIQFLHALEMGGGGLRTATLRLTAVPSPAADAASETWAAQVALTALIFAPKADPPSRNAVSASTRSP